MRKGKMIIIFGVFFALLLISGCASRAQSTQQNREDDVQVYVLVTKAEGNTYNDLMAQGFQKVIDEAGGNGIIASPAEATAEAQIEMLRDLIFQGVDSIAIAANDSDALSKVLQEAMAEGIKVSTVDSDVNFTDRQIFVNQVSTETIARTLVEAVYDICGGSGQWAILSATSTATNQNAWIRAMRGVMEEEKYQDLRLVDIVYGNDESELSREMTEKLLEEYPDLKVICAPTSMGLKAVAEVVTEHPESEVRITGLGLPSDMAQYVVGDDPICPYLFLWNPIDLGQMSAYVSLALVSGEISGVKGEIFEAGSMGSFQVEENENGATEVIVAPPIRFDASNIEEWKDLF